MAANMCMQQNCTDSTGFLYEMIADDMWNPWNTAIEYLEHTPWLFSLIGSTMIGLTGIFPLLVIPIEEGADLKTGDSAGTLRVLLSFAVGGLLGDVFLHLLPEAWGNSSMKRGTDAGHPSMTCGLWILSGFLAFVIVEKLFGFEQEAEEEDGSVKTTEVCEKATMEVEKEMENNNCIDLLGDISKNGFSKRLSSDFSKAINELQPFLEKKNGYSQLANGYKGTHRNGFVMNGTKPVLSCNELSDTLKGLLLDEAKGCLQKLAKTNSYSTELLSKDGSVESSGNQKAVAKEKPRHITGYLNLIANIIDNFTHGLAVGGSFLVSFRLGALTTFAILIHEIPHEVGDFAILLRSGFNRWDAARAQLITASGGIFGAMSAIFFSSGAVGATSWILPFTAGGFLHIGLVTILPELLKESSPKESLKQVAALIFGIIVMAVLTILCD